MQRIFSLSSIYTLPAGPQLPPVESYLTLRSERERERGGRHHCARGGSASEVRAAGFISVQLGNIRGFCVNAKEREREIAGAAAFLLKFKLGHCFTGKNALSLAYFIYILRVLYNGRI